MTYSGTPTMPTSMPATMPTAMPARMPITGQVAAVVVSWQQRELTLRALESLAAQTCAHEVLVVDNASTDGTVEAIRARFPATHVLLLERNVGFAGAMAAALEFVDTRYLALLNNDAEADPHWLDHSLEVLTDRSVAAVTPKMLLTREDQLQDPQGRSRPRLVNNAGVVLLDTGYGCDRGLGEPDDERFAEPVEVFGFSGGAAVLRTLAVKAVGGFDPEYFLYYEDTDLSWRLRLAGWSIRYCPHAQVWHRHGASTGLASRLFAFHTERNRLLMLLTNAPWAFAARGLVAFVVTTGSLAARKMLRRQVPADQVFRVGLRMTVLGSVATRLGQVLRKRRAVVCRRSRQQVLRDWRGIPARAVARPTTKTGL